MNRKHIDFMSRLHIICLMLTAPSLHAATTQPSFILNRGNEAGFKRLFAKADRGEPITLAFIGGSITQGYAASKPENRYVNRVASWFTSSFPKSSVTLVNAGIGATGSDYGCLRVGRDVLSKKPDFVVIEFSVNDANTLPYAQTYEGVVRQTLTQVPAALLLVMTQEDGTSAQEFDAKIGQHYQLPIISYHDAVFELLRTRHLSWKDISPDNIHPNDDGMAFAASFVTQYLSSVRSNADAARANQADASVLPTPLFSDLYTHTALYEAAELKPTQNHGWTFDEKQSCWISAKPGSVMQFEITGSDIRLMFYRIHQNFGRARITVDSGMPQILDGWFDQTWGGKRELVEIAHDLPFKTHQVQIELLEDKSQESDGHEFRVLGIGVAGVKSQ